jgi:hypothetical protein
MQITMAYWLTLLGWGLMCWCGCAPAWHPAGLGDLALQPGRYLERYYRSPNLDPTAGEYQVEAFSLEQVQGLGQDQARTLFNEELLQAMAANGLKVSREKPRFVLTGRVDRLRVATPTWRFLSGRAQADLRVVGEIRQGQEVVFAFVDEVAINPPVNPQHRPPLETDLIARLVVRRFTTNLLNELLLPAKAEPRPGAPAAPGPTR